jgi:hypothetical protein
MFRRLVALWLVLPPTSSVVSWADFCLQSRHCGHEFCSCREHCARKPSEGAPCHEAAPEPEYTLGDACHAGEARELLALSTYLLPEPTVGLFRDDAFVVSRDRESDPRLGFGRIELPPPRDILS